MLRKTLLITLTTALALPLSAAADRPMIDPATRELQKDQLLPEFDVSNPQIDLDRLVVGIPRKDAIPAITDPKRIPGDSADYLGADDRVIVVEVNGEAVAYPFAILNWHEIVNDTVGGQPVVVVYCPLCDSASAAHRTLEVDGETETLEFGVSGFLLYSNVVMYERTTDALWSQVAMEALTGPHAGRALEHLPARVIGFDEFIQEHPEGETLSVDTGYDREYGRSPYQQYFDSDDVYYLFEHRRDVPTKTLGMGVLAGDHAWFVPQLGAVDEPVEIKTPAGKVVVTADHHGMQAEEAPEGVRTIQTFWHSWSAFHPETEIVPAPEEIESLKAWIEDEALRKKDASGG